MLYQLLHDPNFRFAHFQDRIVRLGFPLPEWKRERTMYGLFDENCFYSASELVDAVSKVPVFQTFRIAYGGKENGDTFTATDFTHPTSSKSKKAEAVAFLGRAKDFSQKDTRIYMRFGKEGSEDDNGRLSFMLKNGGFMCYRIIIPRKIQRLENIPVVIPRAFEGNSIEAVANL